MARHLYVYQGRGYEGELALFRRAHVAATAAEAVTLPGLRPRFLFRITDTSVPTADPLITDDEVTVRRYVTAHPDATVALIPMVQ